MDKALKSFEASERLMPSNVHNRFNRAITLVQMGRDQDGLLILKELERQCPKEP